MNGNSLDHLEIIHVQEKNSNSKVPLNCLISLPLYKLYMFQTVQAKLSNLVHENQRPFINIVNMLICRISRTFIYYLFPTKPEIIIPEKKTYMLLYLLLTNNKKCKWRRTNQEVVSRKTFTQNILNQVL